MVLDLKEFAFDAVREENKSKRSKTIYSFILLLVSIILYCLLGYKEQVLECNVDTDTCSVYYERYLGPGGKKELVEPHNIKDVYIYSYSYSTKLNSLFPKYSVCFSTAVDRDSCFFFDVYSKKRINKAVKTIRRLLKDNDVKNIRYKY